MEKSKVPRAQDNSSNQTDDTQNNLAFADTSSSEGGSPPSQPEHDGGNHHPNDGPWWRDRHFLIQLLIFGAGVVVAFIYGEQLVQMKESNKINREAMESVQRAYMNFFGITSGPGLTSEDRKQRVGIVTVMNFLNAGNTPARKIVAVWNVQPWRGELPDGYDYHDLVQISGKQAKTAQAVLGPHQGLPAELPVSIDNFRAQRAGTDRLFFYGWILYRDVFKDSPDRLTEFCSEIIEVTIGDVTKDIGDPTNAVTWNTKPCREHNCYDEDCRDYAEKVREFQAR